MINVVRLLFIYVFTIIGKADHLHNACLTVNTTGLSLSDRGFSLQIQRNIYHRN